VVARDVSCTRPGRPCGSPSLLYNRYRGVGLKRLERDDHPSLTSAEVKERVQLYLLVPSVPPPARYRETYAFFLWRCDPTRAMASSFMRFQDHTRRRTTAGRTSLEERSARRRDLYLTTHNTHNRPTSMTPAGFEPIIPASERPQTYALDRAATGTRIFAFTCR
jgi:hypothetical protein